MKREMREGDRPEGIPATEVVVLHEPETEKSLVILYSMMFSSRGLRMTSGGT
jgi:hypothetical protein